MLVGLQLAGFTFSQTPEPAKYKPAAVWNPRESYYKEIAGFLQPLLEPGDRVAAPEIGALGYFCDCEILDTIGLVSPAAVDYYPVPDELLLSNNAIPPELVRIERPEYIVSLDVFFGRSTMQDPWILENYALVWEREADFFGSEALQVFAFQGEK